MKTCEKYQDNIYFFNTLGEDQKAEIHQHIKNCVECRDLFGKIVQINANLKSNGKSDHPDFEILESYAISGFSPKEHDFTGRQLSKNEISSIENHVASCKLCSVKVNSLKTEFEDMNRYWDESEFPDFQMGPATLTNRIQQKVISLFGENKKAVSYRLIPLSIAAMVLFFVFSQSLFFSEVGNPISQLGAINDVYINYSVRGSEQSLLQQGIQAINEKNYLSAVNSFEESIRQNLDDPNKSYNYYLCGLSMILQAQKNSADQSDPENKELLEKGIKNLQIANSTSGNQSIREDALWCTAKAYLMKNDIEKARQFFKETQALKGRRFNESRDILKSLENY